MCNDRFCQIVNEEIDCDICYETVMALTAGFNVKTIPEMNITDLEKAKKLCDNCKYSNLE